MVWNRCSFSLFTCRECDLHVGGMDVAVKAENILVYKSSRSLVIGT